MSDDLPERRPARLTVLPLDMLGVSELHGYIAELKAEITRVEATIVHKQGHRDAAESVFGKRNASE